MGGNVQIDSHLLGEGIYNPPLLLCASTFSGTTNTNTLATPISSRAPPQSLTAPLQSLAQEPFWSPPHCCLPYAQASMLEQALFPVLFAILEPNGTPGPRCLCSTGGLHGPRLGTVSSPSSCSLAVDTPCPWASADLGCRHQTENEQMFILSLLIATHCMGLYLSASATDPLCTVSPSTNIQTRNCAPSKDAWTMSGTEQGRIWELL